MRAGATDDTAIAEYAQAAGFAIVTKDVELVEKLRNAGKSPKLIWIRWGNISNRVLAQLLRGSAILIQHFFEQPADICLELRRRPKIGLVDSVTETELADRSRVPMLGSLPAQGV